MDKILWHLSTCMVIHAKLIPLFTVRNMTKIVNSLSNAVSFLKFWIK